MIEKILKAKATRKMSKNSQNPGQRGSKKLLKLKYSGMESKKKYIRQVQV